MNNAVILYKVPWSHNSLNKPYFMDDTARDSYFNNLESTSVNLENPNIKIAFNREIAIKVNLDITIVEDYNFAIIQYNGKKYYSTIIDSEFAAVGISRIELLRQIHIEKTDFLQYFKNFNISKCTLKNIGTGLNYNFSPSEVVTYNKASYISENFKNSIWNADPIKTVPFYFITLTKEVETVLPNLTNSYSVLFGETSQFICILVPAPRANYPAGYDYFRTLNKESELYNTYVDTVFVEFLNKISPYISNIELFSIPCHNKINNTNKPIVVPFFGWIYNYEEVEYPNDKIIYIHITHTSEQFLPIAPSVENFFFLDVIKPANTLKNLSSSDEIFFHLPENSIKLELKHYTDPDGQCGYTIIYSYIVNPSGVNLLVKIRPYYKDCLAFIENTRGTSRPSFKNANDKVFSFPLIANVSYNEDSKSTFTAENKYYDSLTAESIRHTQRMGDISVQESMMIGAAQMGFGIFGANASQASMGTANIIRGIHTAMETDEKINNIGTVRELEANQMKERPSNSVSGNNAAINNLLLDGKVILKENLPVQESINFLESNKNIYGLKVGIFRPEIVIVDYLNTLTPNNHIFYLQASAEKELTKNINNRDFNELTKLLETGSVYFIPI